MPPGIHDRPIAGTPLAVVDLETTGLCAGPDKIVEIAIARIEPGGAPTVVFDTLVNPHRPVAATEIHGITDADVTDAPGFAEVAGNVTEAVEGAVLGAYNVYFDAKFLGTELGRAGVPDLPPYLCLMYLRPMLDLGRKCTLAEACAAHGIPGTSVHRAAADVLAAARLWQVYLAVLGHRGIRTFGDLAATGTCRFVSSFTRPLYDAGTTAWLRRTSRLRPRAEAAATAAPPGTGLGEYWEAVLAALADMELSPADLESLTRRRWQLGLSEDQIRWVHAKVLSGVMAEATQDKAITGPEAEGLWKVATALRALGWAPGDPPSRGPGQREPPSNQSLLGRIFGSPGVDW